MDARLVGSPGEPRERRYDEDLRDSHGCLLEAGGQIDDALEDDRYPIMLAADCSVCVSTLPALVRRRPDVWILWLDAHGDFNTPDTTPSGFLGGMCLAGACGLWDTGHGAGVDPAHVVMCGVRDLDGQERVLLETSGVVHVERPGDLADTLRGREVFVHLDADVLDPAVMPGQRYPAPGGLSDGGLRNLLGEVAEAAHLVGVEITCFNEPSLAQADGHDRRAAAPVGDRPMSTEAQPSILRPLVEDLHERRAKAKLGGGEEKIAASTPPTSSPPASASRC